MSMKMRHILAFLAVVLLATISALHGAEPAPSVSPNDVATKLAKSVNESEQTTSELEILNSNWRFWTGVIIFVCTGLVTVISAISVFAKDPWSTGLKIGTASLSAIATVLALLPNTFHWESEQRKYGAAFAELVAIDWDLRANTKPPPELVTRYEQVIRVIHDPGSIETVSSTPTPSASQTP
jgi:hypothetical protein